MNHHRKKGDLLDVDTRGKFDTPVMHGSHKPPKRPSPNSSRFGYRNVRRAAEDALLCAMRAHNKETLDFLECIAFARKSIERRFSLPVAYLRPKAA